MQRPLYFLGVSMASFRTVLNYADGKEGVIEGGQLIRNQSDGYVIKGGKLSGDSSFGSIGSHYDSFCHCSL